MFKLSPPVVFKKSWQSEVETFQLSPLVVSPEILVVKGGTMWARNGRWILPEMPDFHIAFRNILHAVNLRHGTDGFTSPPKEDVLRNFSPWKIRRLRPGLNPRTWVPKASTLPLDHRSLFANTLFVAWGREPSLSSKLCLSFLSVLDDREVQMFSKLGFFFCIRISQQEHCRSYVYCVWYHVGKKGYQYFGEIWCLFFQEQHFTSGGRKPLRDVGNYLQVWNYYVRI